MKQEPLHSSDVGTAAVGGAAAALAINSSQAFKPGKPLLFSCTFDAKPKPETDDGPVEDATLADTA